MSNVTKIIIGLWFAMLITPLMAETRYIVNADHVIMRAKPFPTAKIVTHLPPNSTVTLLGTDRTKGYAMVKFYTRSGWVPLDNISAKHEHPQPIHHVPQSVLKASPENEQRHHVPDVESKIYQEPFYHNSLFRISTIVICLLIIIVIIPRLRQQPRGN